MDGFDLGSIIAHIRADTSQFTAELESAKTQADGFAGHLSTIAAGVGALVDVAIVGFGVASIKAFSEAQVITAQLDQVLKTTGKSATITSSYVEGLAMQLENYSGQTHGAIEAGQTILLQFAGITKETLPEASKAMVDLSQRMGVDTVTAAKTLGIALDNPSVGLTRLKRDGIDFTTAQVEAIKALQKSGDTAGAASLMMQILETKVGGAAGAYRNTLAGSISEAKAKFKDFEEGVGKNLIQWLTDAFNWYQRNSRVVNDFAGVIGTIIGVLAVALVLYGNWILLTKTLAIVQAALNLIMDMNPIVLAIMAVVLIAALLLEHWKDVKQWFDDFMSWLKAHWELVVAIFFPFMAIPMLIIAKWDDLKQWFNDFKNFVMGIFDGAVNWLYNVGKDIIQGLINGVENMANAVKQKVSDVANGIKDVAKKILGVFSPSKVFHEIGTNVGQGLINGINSMQSAVSGASSNMAQAAVAPTSAIVNNTPNSMSSSVNTTIHGGVNIGSNVDANRFLRKLTYNQELAKKGGTPTR